ncbi:MAG: hypothetical protein R8G66_19810 [Cytophagales bacterium]|nr:hypothetical protein [Cytophagales bacterium]
MIAVQINSISQNKKRTKLEKVLLAQIKFEILETFADVWRDAGILEQGAKSHQDILHFIEEDSPYTDSLCFDFHWIQIDEYVYPTTAAYDRLKEMGLELISNDEIRILLQSLYEGHFPRLRKFNSFTPDITTTFHDYYLNSFKPNSDPDLSFDFYFEDVKVGNLTYSDVYYQFTMNNGQTIGYKPLDFEALKDDPKFMMLLDKTNRYRINRIRHYTSVRSIIKDVIHLIDQELE